MSFRIFHPARSFAALAAIAIAIAASAAAQPPAAQQEDIRAPRSLIEIPVQEPAPVALWSSVAAGSFALLGAFLLYRKFTRKTPPPSPPEVALAELDHLATTRESLSAETFANHAASTLRDYVAARFGLAAPRRTTEEFLHDLAGGHASPLSPFGDSLRAFLTACDLAKFAGARLNIKQREDLLESARTFIKATAAHEDPQRKPLSP